MTVDNRASITPSEYHDISTAVRDPGFPALFADYVREVADPRNRSETVEYFSTMLANREVPQGKKLVKPRPWLCLEARTNLLSISGSVKSSIFVNLLFSDEFDDMEINQETGEVRVPFISSPVRLEQTDNAMCTICDILLGASAPGEVERHGERVLFVIIESVIDFLNANQFKNNNLSRDVRIRRDWKYLNAIGEELMIPFIVESKSKMSEVNPPDTTIAQPMESRPLSESTDHVRTDSEQLASFKIIEMGHLNYGEFMDTNTTSSCPVVHWRVPEKLRIIIRLPGVESAGRIETSFNEASMQVSAGSHSLTIPLVYKVDEESASARFFKESSRLEIELKVTV